MTIGDTVFVRWYGKILEGMIVENNEITPALASMVLVRIPVQGVRASALYTPQHVYPNAELAGMKEGIKLVPTESPTFVPTAEATPNDGVSELYRKLQEFKLANWDTEHNHIKIAALNDFYDLWVTYMRARSGAMKQTKHTNIIKTEAPVTNEEAMQPFKRIVSDEKMAELKSQIKKALAPAKSKPRKTVKYTQLSLWD